MHPGTLYIVSTPIGNLEDITLRALRILKEVSTIAAEDTRHTGKLLAHFEIHTPMTSYHDFNKEAKTPVMIKRLEDGESFALVSDAGTPTISDPGYFLIKEAIIHEIPISPIPGPSAVIAALCVSGLPTDRFIFEGFLARKKGKRDKQLEHLKDNARSLIFYESPYRIVSLLEAIYTIFGDRRVSIGRELTKRYEEIIRGKVSQVLKQLEGRTFKGEACIVVEGYIPPKKVKRTYLKTEEK
ncbi:16S rRNA (cytidine(1402)-2'-O)-methyltransferase [hydrothermal vent metagenome]|uniref:16S rRNA (Cytidine(1402)-2'-O)-methyltransferase n=1 Tax=hydrothermal vent metagenome TaxID=652676 RepID=A0A3B1DTR6_9ZZZZ